MPKWNVGASMELSPTGLKFHCPMDFVHGQQVRKTALVHLWLILFIIIFNTYMFGIFFPLYYAFKCVLSFHPLPLQNAGILSALYAWWMVNFVGKSHI